MPMSASVAAESLPLEGNGLTLDDRPHLYPTKRLVTQFIGTAPVLLRLDVSERAA